VPDTRAGPLTIWTSERGVRRIEFGALPRGRAVEARDGWPPLLRRAVHQVEEYLAGHRADFDLPLDFSGVTSGFQQDVYDRLRRIAYGRVTSYGQIATDIGKPDQARAVGQAVGANPIPIVVPCHRVVGSNGRLTGFSGGLGIKVSLLKLEGIDVDGARPSSRVYPDVIPLDLR